MFLYPALLLGFLFVGVPLLVHLINMLRHRRRRWAAMDFLLASYRKQKKWIRLRQLLLLLSRLAVAALLIAMLCGWSGGNRLLGALGGRTTHHVVILDDSYSMGDASGGSTAYSRSLQALQDLTRRLASEDGNHQLTVMRASRAALAVRGGSEAGDSAADLSAQTISSDARLINRVMATQASSVRTDITAAAELAAELVRSTPADSKYIYIASDFRQRDWQSPERLAESLRGVEADEVEVRMIDCAAPPIGNLGITNVAASEDVWVAGVPVVVRVTVHNYGDAPVRNVSVACRVIRYSSEVQVADPTRQFSGEVESLPALLIESLAADAEITKSFQVFVTETGTHAIEVSLPDDALSIDNTRSCTLPLSDAEKVLIIDGDDTDPRGAYHVAAVLNPGSQVRIGAIPDVQPTSFLRSISLETLASYRAVYLIDVPTISASAADALRQYVMRGGGLAFFLGSAVRSEDYNRELYDDGRYLLPGRLAKPIPLPRSVERTSGDIIFAERSSYLDPLSGSGDAAFALVGVAQSWSIEAESLEPENSPGSANPTPETNPTLATNQRDDVIKPRIRKVLDRVDGQPMVLQHDLGRGRVVTVTSGLDGSWTNWPSDPTFVPFLLLTNATLWGGAAAPTSRIVDESLVRVLSSVDYAPEASYLPATDEPPRVAIDVTAQDVDSDASPSPESDAEHRGAVIRVGFDPSEMVIDGDDNVNEILRPGVSEWMLTRSDGSTTVVPVASVIRTGEGDLKRAEQAEIAQELMPLKVKFVSSSVWSEENRTAGSSTFALVLLGLLGLVLAAEQLLAYLASYHVSTAHRGASSMGSLKR